MLSHNRHDVAIFDKKLSILFLFYTIGVLSIRQDRQVLIGDYYSKGEKKIDHFIVSNPFFSIIYDLSKANFNNIADDIDESIFV